MAFRVGGIDIAQQSLENEFFIKLIDKVLDWLYEHNSQLHRPTDQDIIRMRQEVLEELQRKYPDAGITQRENNR